MEIITGVERRRRWRLDEKLRIVAEAEAPGACFVEIARRHDVSRGLLWRIHPGRTAGSMIRLRLVTWRASSSKAGGHPGARPGDH